MTNAIDLEEPHCGQRGAALSGVHHHAPLIGVPLLGFSGCTRLYVRVR